ncbi:MAG: hypothetical protein ACOCV4_07985 [Myxococcota bacterium]
MALLAVALAVAPLAGCDDDPGGTDDAGPQDAAGRDSGGQDSATPDAAGDAGIHDSGTPDAAGDAGDGAPCAERTGGALVQFRICDEPIALWITDGDFIDEAIENAGEDPGRVPVFGEVVAGTDCDPQWSWHVQPDDALWADATIELCDGCPSYLEDNLDDWIDQVGNYCPWAAEVETVDDRR